MKKNSLGKLVQLLLVIAILSDYGCNKSDDNSNSSGQYAVKIAIDDNLGQYLEDKDGQALYYFSNDHDGRNSCAGGCAAIWPYFYAGELTQAKLGEGLDLADFDTIIVKGINQTRYKGWPLYYYAPQGTSLEPRGQITGEAIPNWLVAKPDYSIMLVNAQLVGNDGKNYLNSYAEGTGKTVYFTDAYGVTLYTFKIDSFEINKYTTADFSNNGYWPIYEKTNIIVPSTLDKNLFSVINVFNRKQMTYKGWPLYYFGPDQNIRGNNKGVSVPSPGVWPVPEKDMNAAPQK
jgi:predicted lipoprotein with Yx(FWY)xxD motif